jgi:hypothetical protein
MAASLAEGVCEMCRLNKIDSIEKTCDNCPLNRKRGRLYVYIYIYTTDIYYLYSGSIKTALRKPATTAPLNRKRGRYLAPIFATDIEALLRLYYQGHVTGPPRRARTHKNKYLCYCQIYTPNFFFGCLQIQVLVFVCLCLDL